jgi:hypothetical protein
MNAACKDCRWCERREHDGTCRINPPRMRGAVTDTGDGAWAAWPIVNTNDWCGKFSPIKPPWDIKYGDRP